MNQIEGVTLDILDLHLPVKGISGCIRKDWSKLPKELILKSTNENPKAGDLVLVESTSDDGIYKSIEQSDETEVPIKKGDRFIGVLANRYSGTSLNASVPVHSIAAGGMLRLIAAGGLVAVETKSRIQPPQGMPLIIIGFPAHKTKILNTKDYPAIEADQDDHEMPDKIICVCGTSAEVGKTTTVASLANALRAENPNLRLAAIKACGTGRLRDRRAYKNAGIEVCIDFVDFGLPSTYGLTEEETRLAISSMLNFCQTKCDICIVELGGDFLEAGAPGLLTVLIEFKAKIAFVVNDAMGALEGISRLKAMNCKPWAVGSYKQNIESLAQRIGVPYEVMFLPNSPSSLRSQVRLLDL